MKTIAGIVAGVILLIALIYVGVGIYYTPMGEQTMIINRMEGTTSIDNTPGWSFATPFINKTQNVSVAEQIYERTDNANTEDNVQLTYSFNVNFKIEEVNKLYDKRYTLQVENTQQLINAETTKALDIISNQYTYDYIKGNIAGVGDEVTDVANDQLKEYGIIINGINIIGIVAPENIDASINEKIVKQQQAEASKYEVEKAENEAEAQRIKQDTINQEQQQIELCSKAIEKGNGNSASCYFGDGTYVNGGSAVVGGE